jgi:hypothetical protein
MNLRLLTYDDCYLLSNICLNSERISYRIEKRFKSNSNRTSFDFKSFLPEKPSNNTKVSRSLLKIYPINESSVNTNDENLSSESSESETEEIPSPKLPLDTTNDDFLNVLLEWDPNKAQPVNESDIEEEEEVRNDTQQINNDTIPSDHMDISTGKPITIDSCVNVCSSRNTNNSS